jgi:RecA/RadA recombinase
MSLKKNKTKNDRKETEEKELDIEDTTETKKSSSNKSTKQDTGISDAMDAIRAKFGEDSIMKLGEKPKVNINAIPTGSLGLDWALGIGGVPRGRIIEVFGPESSGKTTLALHIVAEAQKLGGVCAYIDAEHAMDPEYATRLGVKIDDLLISQPDTGEQALDIVDSLIRTNKMDVVVIDSVAALTPKAEIQGDDANQYHHHLKKAIKHLQKITRKTGKLQTIEHITKQQVITTLQKQGLYPHTWYCENPQNTQEPPTQEPPTLGPHNLKQNQDPEHSTPCHHCQPCRTHANALWNIQQDNQPKT